MQKLPTIKFGDFQKFVTSDEVVAVGSAIIITPLLLKSIEAIVAKVPFLRDHFSVGLAIAAFVIFILAGKMTKQGSKLRPVLVGIAGGVLITAIAPFFEGALKGGIFK